MESNTIRHSDVEKMNKDGFFIHYLPGNIHTHGMEESFNHLNFQLCIPVKFFHAESLIHTLVNRIKEGVVFNIRNIYTDILTNESIRFSLVKEDGRPVLRIILL